MNKSLRIYFLFFSIKSTSLPKINSVCLGAPIMISRMIPSLSTIKCPGATGVKSYIRDLDIEPCSYLNSVLLRKDLMSGIVSKLKAKKWISSF